MTLFITVEMWSGLV